MLLDEFIFRLTMAYQRNEGPSVDNDLDNVHFLYDLNESPANFVVYSRPEQYQTDKSSFMDWHSKRIHKLEHMYGDYDVINLRQLSLPLPRDGNEICTKAWIKVATGANLSALCGHIAYDWARVQGSGVDLGDQTEQVLHTVSSSENAPTISTSAHVENSMAGGDTIDRTKSSPFYLTNRNKEPYSLVLWVKLEVLLTFITVCCSDMEVTSQGALYFIAKYLCIRFLRADNDDSSLFLAVGSLLESNSANTLWLLEGYDGFDGQGQLKRIQDIFQYLNEQSNIYIVSRPENVLQMMGINRAAFREIEFLGLQRHSILKCLNYYLDRSSNTDNVSQLKDILAKNPIIYDIAHVPENLRLLCELVQRDSTALQSLTVTQCYQHIVSFLFWHYRRYTLHREGVLSDDLPFDKNTTLQWMEDKKLVFYLGMMALNKLIPSDPDFVADMSFTDYEISHYMKFITAEKDDADLVLQGLLKSKILIRITTLDQNISSNVRYIFLHHELHIYFAAEYIASLWRTMSPDTVCVNTYNSRTCTLRSLLQQYKYYYTFTMVWPFVAGLLDSEPDKLKTFADLFDEPPLELKGYFHEPLIIRCLGQLAIDTWPVQWRMLYQNIMTKEALDLHPYEYQLIFVTKEQWRNDLPESHEIFIYKQEYKVGGTYKVGTLDYNIPGIADALERRHTIGFRRLKSAIFTDIDSASSQQGSSVMDEFFTLTNKGLDHVGALIAKEPFWIWLNPRDIQRRAPHLLRKSWFSPMMLDAFSDSPCILRQYIEDMIEHNSISAEPALNALRSIPRIGHGAALTQAMILSIADCLSGHDKRAHSIAFELLEVLGSAAYQEPLISRLHAQLQLKPKYADVAFQALSRLGRVAISEVFLRKLEGYLNVNGVYENCHENRRYLNALKIIQKYGATVATPDVLESLSQCLFYYSQRVIAGDEREFVDKDLMKAFKSIGEYAASAEFLAQIEFFLSDSLSQQSKMVFFTRILGSFGEIAADDPLLILIAPVILSMYYPPSWSMIMPYTGYLAKDAIKKSLGKTLDRPLEIESIYLLLPLALLVMVLGISPSMPILLMFMISGFANLIWFQPYMAIIKASGYLGTATSNSLADRLKKLAHARSSAIRDNALEALSKSHVRNLPSLKSLFEYFAAQSNEVRYQTKRILSVYDNEKEFNEYMSKLNSADENELIYFSILKALVIIDTRKDIMPLLNNMIRRLDEQGYTSPRWIHYVQNRLLSNESASLVIVGILFLMFLFLPSLWAFSLVAYATYVPHSSRLRLDGGSLVSMSAAIAVFGRAIFLDSHLGMGLMAGLMKILLAPVFFIVTLYLVAYFTSLPAVSRKTYGFSFLSDLAENIIGEDQLFSQLALQISGGKANALLQLLIAKLQDGDIDMRKQALRVVKALGAAAAKKDKLLTRATVLRDNRKSSSLMKTLAQVIKNGQSDIIKDAFQVFGYFNYASIGIMPALKKLLSSNSVELHGWTYLLLCHLGEPIMVEFMRPLLESEDYLKLADERVPSIVMTHEAYSTMEHGYAIAFINRLGEMSNNTQPLLLGALGRFWHEMGVARGIVLPPPSSSMLADFTLDRAALASRRAINKIQVGDIEQLCAIVPAEPDGDCGFTAIRRVLRLQGRANHPLFKVVESRQAFIHWVITLANMPQYEEPLIQQLLVHTNNQRDITAWARVFASSSYYMEEVHFQLLSKYFNCIFQIYYLPPDINGGIYLPEPSYEVIDERASAQNDGSSWLIPLAHVDVTFDMQVINHFDGIIIEPTQRQVDIIQRMLNGASELTIWGRRPNQEATSSSFHFSTQTKESMMATTSTQMHDMLGSSSLAGSSISISPQFAREPDMLLRTLPVHVLEIKASIEAEEQLLRQGYQAISAGNISGLRMLIAENETLPVTFDIHKQSLLHYAVKMGDYHIAEELIAAGADSSAQTTMGLQPIHIAASQGHITCIESLYNRGVFEQELSIEVSLQGYTFKVTALGLAILRGHIDALDTLFQPYIRTDQLRVPGEGNILHIAVLANDVDMLSALMTHPIVVKSLDDLYNEYNRNGDTPLHLAIRLGYLSCANVLLKHEKINIIRANPEGRTILHIAALTANKQAIDVILRYITQEIAAFVRAPDKQDKKARQLALRKAKECRERHDETLAKRYDLVASHLRNINTAAIHKIHSVPVWRTLFNNHPVRNLVFQGGGPTGAAYVPALRVLEAKLGELGGPLSLGSGLSFVERVGGTSAGAITAFGLALGMDLDALENTLDRLDFMSLLDNISSSELGFMKTKVSDLIDNPDFSHFIHAGLELIKHVYHCRNNATALYYLVNNRHAIADDLMRFEGLCSGEGICIWLEGLIVSRWQAFLQHPHYRTKAQNWFEEDSGLTDIKYLTFGHLRRLKALGLPVKHLYVVTLKVSSHPAELVTFNSEDSQWDHVRIVDAVRASMSIPGLFKPHQFTYIDSHTQLPRTESFMDGGLLMNFPIKLFDRLQFLKRIMPGDDNYPIFNEETRGFRLDNLGRVAELPTMDITLREWLPQMAKAFWNAEALIGNCEQKYQWRSITIDNLGLDTFDFDMTPEDKQRLMLSGAQAVEASFAQYDRDARSLSTPSVLMPSSSSSTSGMQQPRLSDIHFTLGTRASQSSSSSSSSSSTSLGEYDRPGM